MSHDRKPARATRRREVPKAAVDFVKAPTPPLPPFPPPPPPRSRAGLIFLLSFTLGAGLTLAKAYGVLPSPLS